jgi:death-on-curing protein
VNYLSVKQLLFLHMLLIDATGGTQGVRDVGLLEAAAARPRATYGARELYAEVFAKAAALMHSLILNHPMIDGNKRLSIAAAGLFLERNGYRLIASNEALEAFTLEVAQGLYDVTAIARWLTENSKATSTG